MPQGKSEHYIVDGSVLPEVFIRVCEAKSLLESGEAATVAEAVARAGLSRSAFYKYKDFITPVRGMRGEQVLTLSIQMLDRPGALSSVLAIFAAMGVNILTISQAIPSNGAAIVIFSVTTEGMTVSFDELKTRIEALPAVKRLELIAG